MKKRREINVFSISFLDLLSGALGAVIILYVAIPKNKSKVDLSQPDVIKEALQRNLAEQKDKLKQAAKIIKELQEKLTAAQVKAEVAAEVAEDFKVEEKPIEEGRGIGSTDFDVGFKFKGKSVVFIIDTSYSMVEEDRMGQVKAGLRMLLTSLPSTFKIELIQYPLGERAPFKSLWGTTRESGKFNKNDAFEFIYRLRPSGGTPTRDALLYALRNYGDMTDLVLLTDGVPTYHNSNKKDDIWDILRVVREENKNKVQISTIGVGTNFLADKTSDQYKFLSSLALESGGFFVGF